MEGLEFMEGKPGTRLPNARQIILRTGLTHPIDGAYIWPSGNWVTVYPPGGDQNQGSIYPRNEIFRIDFGEEGAPPSLWERDGG